MPKESYCIGNKAAQTNYYAAQQAKHINYPLNYHVTINFSLTNIDPKEAAKCFAKMRGERFNKWASRPRKNAGKAFPPTFVFAFENNKDGTAYMTLEQNNPHNVHVHWSLHIPPARFYDFENMLWKWVSEATGGILDKKAIHIAPLIAETTSYLLKGAKPDTLKKYGRGQQHEPQGIIYGRRAGTSLNIGPTARRKTDKERGINRRYSYNQKIAHYDPPTASLGAI